MLHLSFLGAARTVTGSQYLVDATDERVLVDCGMFQGERELRRRNWAELPYEPRDLAAVILTHTHLDHVGRLPRLVRLGFDGPVYCTPPTRELAEILLNDAAHLQEEDAGYFNRKGLTKHAPALPLFTKADVAEALELFRCVPLGESQPIGRRFSFAFRDAGHLLGAASVDLRVKPEGRERRLLFSGDVGRYDSVLARDPAPAPPADYIVMESTYGNRAHAESDVREQLLEVIQRTFDRNGVLLIPAFAVGRAQQLIFLMDELVTHGRLRPFPIHLDSPMAIDATRIYAQFPDAHRVSLNRIGGRSLLHGRFVQVHRSRQESEKLNELRGPAVIISSSGMLSGGRILHHCRVRLPQPENTLLITGYQAAETLGRALLEGRRVVRIHKGDVPVRAEIAELKGLSGHADADELLRWLSEVTPAPACVYLTHGEPESAAALGERLRRERGFRIHVPELGESALL
jgi:metallo-beta-lactamase family protein